MRQLTVVRLYYASELNGHCTASKVKNSENNYKQFLNLIKPNQSILISEV